MRDTTDPTTGLAYPISDLKLALEMKDEMKYYILSHASVAFNYIKDNRFVNFYFIERTNLKRGC